jgi:hypothetical protein
MKSCYLRDQKRYQLTIGMGVEPGITREFIHWDIQSYKSLHSRSGSRTWHHLPIYR